MSECRECRPPGGYLTAGDEDLFPAAWRPLHEHPNLQPASWVPSHDTAFVRYCRICGTFWSVYYDPERGYYSEVEALPDSARAVLTDGSPAEAVAALCEHPSAAVRRLARAAIAARGGGAGLSPENT